jgi:medium-chain acyl-[acyl-carrier-protein] hydrolase
MTNWIAYHRPNPAARLQLFCLPYAGGGASIYRSWCNEMPKSIEVFPIQLPGREGRIAEPPFTRVAALAEAIAEEILPLLDRPFAFFGHSLGAKVCFEVARYLLNRYGLSAAHLFASACNAPHLPNTEQSLHDLPHDRLVEKLRFLNGTSGKILDHPRVLRMLLPLIRADFELYDTYRYLSEPFLDCPITVFGGDNDPVVDRERLWAWRGLAVAGFDLRLFPGDHFFLHTSQSFIIQAIVEALGEGDDPADEAPCSFRRPAMLETSYPQLENYHD